MPIYMYRCGECQQTCEALQHSTDAPLLECPACHAHALHKIIAPVGIIFKGHGFYKTDNVSGASGEGHRREDVVHKNDDVKCVDSGSGSVEKSASSAEKVGTGAGTSGDTSAKANGVVSTSSGAPSQQPSTSGKVAS